MDGKLLVLTATPPDKTTFGGRFVHELIAFMGPQRAVMVLLDNAGITGNRPCPTLNLKMPASPRINKQTTRVSSLEERIYRFFRQRFFSKLERQVQEITSFASTNNVSHILCILDHPAIIWLAKPVASALNCKYSTYLTEIPETTLLQEGYDDASKALIHREFSLAIKSAHAAGFASSEMAAFYEKKEAVKGEVILAPEKEIEGSRIGSSAGDLEDTDRIRIGCLLNHRHHESLKDFIAGCQNMSWMLAGRSVRLILIGKASGISFTFAGKPADIEILGGLCEEETVQSLKECAFNFLPFWTKQDYSDAARLCLPDDLPTYLSAERPLVAYSTEQSQVAATIREFSLGGSIEKSDEKSFTTAMETLFNISKDNDFDERCRKASKALYSRKLFLTGLESLLPQALLEKKSTV